MSTNAARSPFIVSFAIVGGALLSLTLFIGVPIFFCGVVPFIVGGHATYQDVQRRAKDKPKRDAEHAANLALAKRLAFPRLQQYGIVALSDDTELSPADGKMMLHGSGRDARGTVHQIAVRFLVARFGGKAEWTIEAVMIDETVREHIY